MSANEIIAACFAVAVVAAIIAAILFARSRDRANSRIANLAYWKDAHCNDRSKDMAATDAAKIAFIKHAAGGSVNRVGIDVRGPVLPAPKQDGRRYWIPRAWSRFILIDEDGRMHPWGDYAEKFVGFKRYHGLGTFPRELLRDMLDESAKRQAVEVTRSWVVPFWGPESEAKLRVPVHVDIFADAQRRFDRTLEKLQAALDQNKDAIDRLAKLILAQEPVVKPYVLDGKQWASMTLALTEVEVQEFFRRPVSKTT